MEDLKCKPTIWAEAIFIAAVGLGIGYSCSGVNDDPVVESCKNIDKKVFLECVRMRTKQTGTDNPAK